MRHALRDYQRRAVDGLLAALDQRPILVAPTGGGKTTIAAALVERLGVHTLWLAHRKELIEQAAKRLEAHGLACGIVMAGEPTMPLARVQVASVQTLVRRAKPPAELIIIDECHHAAASGYRSILEACPNARVVGLTATPFRLDGRGLGELFGALVVAARTDELCDAGVLHRPKVWASQAPDLRGVRVLAGDYSLGALARRANTRALNADVVATWRQRAAGRRTVAFGVDVAHSRAIAAAFADAGVPAEHLDGATPREEREAMLKRLASGETLVISNCLVLTEGWDLPALECAIIARPTASLSLHLQMIGRVMRAADGKDGAIVLDHAGNHHVHGLVTRRLNYSLDGAKVGHSEPLGLRRCRACGLLFELHVFACPECGWTPAPPLDRDGRIVAGVELTEFDDASFEYRRHIWNLLEAERIAAGYLEGWSVFRFQERFGEPPVVAEIEGVCELVDPAHATKAQKRAVYARLLETARERGFAEGWAAHRYREVFGCWPRGFVGELRNAGLRKRFRARQEASAS